MPPPPPPPPIFDLPVQLCKLSVNWQTTFAHTVNIEVNIMVLNIANSLNMFLPSQIHSFDEMMQNCLFSYCKDSGNTPNSWYISGIKLFSDAECKSQLSEYYKLIINNLELFSIHLRDLERTCAFETADTKFEFALYSLTQFLARLQIGYPQKCSITNSKTPHSITLELIYSHFFSILRTFLHTSLSYTHNIYYCVHNTHIVSMLGSNL